VAGSTAVKVRFISYDDKSDPSAALDLTRDLIEKQRPLDVRSFGTPGNFAVRTYLNEKFLNSLSPPERPSKTIIIVPMDNGLATSQEEGRIYANPGVLLRKVIALQNDHFGRELSRGWKTGSVTSPG
jgi:hypothetical protein